MAKTPVKAKPHDECDPYVRLRKLMAGDTMPTLAVTLINGNTHNGEPEEVGPHWLKMNNRYISTSTIVSIVITEPPEAA